VDTVVLRYGSTELWDHVAALAGRSQASSA